MANFENLIENKQNFIRLFLEDEELVKCLGSTRTDFLNDDVDPESLLQNNIFPCKYIPGVNEEAKAFIAIGCVYEPNDASKKHYRTSLVTFYIFCHQNLIKTDYGALRYDYALQRVDRIVCGSRSAQWLGEMVFDGAEDTILDVKGEYVGVSVTYRSVEFA